MLEPSAFHLQVVAARKQLHGDHPDCGTCEGLRLLQRIELQPCLVCITARRNVEAIVSALLRQDDRVLAFTDDAARNEEFASWLAEATA